MRKRNAVSAAALASIGFGGAATALVNAQHHVTAPTSSVQANGVHTGSPARRRVVTLYVDDPPGPTVSAPTTLVPGSSAAARRGSRVATAPAPPSTVPPSTVGTVPGHSQPVPTRNDPPSREPSRPVSSTTTSVATTVPPVTTTTAASRVGHSGSDDSGHDD